MEERLLILFLEIGSNCFALVDHMVGLRSTEFHTLLRKKESAYIYCSELTALFLSQNHLQGLDKKIRALSVNQEHTIFINEQDGFLTVTPLPAGHCPGSYMSVLLQVCVFPFQF